MSGFFTDLASWVQDTFSTPWAIAITISLILSVIICVYVCRRKKISFSFEKENYDALTVLLTSIGFCVFVIFGLIPSFFYMLAGDFHLSPWVIFNEQAKILPFIGAILMTWHGLRSLFKK
jgi:uncharacterized protein with PQ loop repeat